MAERVCPYWVGYFLVSPLRRIVQSPEKILAPFVKPGMTVLDIGSGMGYFSLPLSRMVGAGGRVVCVDMQEKMIRGLERRAHRAGVADRIITRISPPNSLGLEEFEGQIDFALLFAVAHEMPDIPAAFGEISKAVKSGGKWLVAEPRGHVSEKTFAGTVSIAERKGFSVIATPRITWSHAVLLKKI